MAHLITTKIWSCNFKLHLYTIITNVGEDYVCMKRFNSRIIGNLFKNKLALNNGIKLFRKHKI